MLRAETVPPTSLSSDDASVWRELCAARRGFSNPLLGPDFTQAVALVRNDVRVTVWREHGRPIGFLPHHRRPGGFARPIGAPLSDYHAMVTDRSLNVEEMLAAADINAYRFTGLIDPAGCFSDHVTARRIAFRIELRDTADAYLEELRRSRPKRFKNYRRLDHKLSREMGPLSVVAPDDSAAAFEQLLAWKHDQLVRTDALNFMRPKWTVDLLRHLFELKDSHFRGLMISLYAGERLVGGHFGVRLGATYHPWIASMNPDLAPWSPGQVFLGRAIAAMPGVGLSVYDLGPTHDHYKRPFALTEHEVAEGLAVAESVGGRAAWASEHAWALVGGDRLMPIRRVRRRLDAIATLEQSLAGRARSFAAAAVTQARGATRP